MTITSRIHEELFAPTTAATAGASQASATRLLVRMPLSHPRGAPAPGPGQRRQRRRRRRVGADPNHLALAWSADEHERFLRGLELFPRGPWKDVAQYVGTRTVRQTMTHAQKYRQKIARHKRGLQADAIKKAASSRGAAATEDGAASSTASCASVGSPVSPDFIVACAAFIPIGCAPGFQPIYSPSSVEEFAFGRQSPLMEAGVWQNVVSVVDVSSPAPFSPPASPRELQPNEYLMDGRAVPVAPASCADDDIDFGFVLDDTELDSLLIDDVIHSVVTQYLEPCPTTS